MSENEKSRDVKSNNMMNLSMGWEIARLAEVADIVMGQSPPSSTYNQDGIGLPFFQGKAEFGELYPTPKVYCSEPKKLAQKEAVLLSVRAPVGPVNLAPSLCSIGRGLSAIHPLGGIPSKFILYFFRSHENTLAKQATGTTFKAISKKTVKGVSIPIPPLNEQRRIVAKIEELFSQLDAGVAALEQARARLKRYRQALLKAAFEGRLTEQWRQARADELEPAGALLARIRAEREARWQAQLTEWEEAVQAWEAAGKPGKKPRKPRQPKALLPLTEEELAALPELPEGWAWVRVANLGEVRLGRQRSPKNHTGPFMRPYLRAANATWDGVDLADVKRMNFSPEEFEIYRLHKGDILLAEASGSADEVGKPILWQEQIPDCCFQNTLIRVRLAEFLFPEFFYLHFLKDARTGRLAQISKGVGIHHLGAERLAALPVALPPLPEQHHIVAELDSHLSVMDYLDQTIGQALARAAGLRQAILKKAFTGRLVPQDAEDEPASALLERIRTETKEALRE